MYNKINMKRVNIKLISNNNQIILNWSFEMNVMNQWKMKIICSNEINDIVVPIETRIPWKPVDRKKIDP